MRSLPGKGSFRLSFEGCGRLVDSSLTVGPDGYPHYNLERLPGAEGSPERLRLIFAVAGFAPEQLDVSVTERHLIVCGDQKIEGDDRQFLHRGIAARRFQRAFLLADGLEVVEADLSDGLLSISICRREPGAIVRVVKIEARDA